MNTKVIREGDALHRQLEVSDIRVVLDQPGNILDFSPLFGRKGGDIATQTAGIMVQTIPRLGHDPRALVVGRNGAQIHGHTEQISNTFLQEPWRRDILLERPRGNATTSFPWRNMNNGVKPRR